MARTLVQRRWARIQELKDILRGAASRTRHLKLDHQTHCAFARECVWEDPQFKRLPQWARWYLIGIDEQLFQELQAAVEFRQLVDGQWTSAAQITTEHYREGRVDLTREGQHFWPGTDRPW